MAYGDIYSGAGASVVGAGSGILDYLRRLGSGFNTPQPSQPPAGTPPVMQAQDTPPSRTTVIPGLTKEDLPTHWGGVPFRPGFGPEDTPQDPDPSHIRFSMGGGGMADYNPNKGIGDYVSGMGNDEPMQSGFMGVAGVPSSGGGGGYSPSQQDWSKVANPEAFEDYTRPVRDLTRQAAINQAGMSATDPLWEERGKAGIWTQSQIDVQKGIRDQMMQDFQEQIKQAVNSVDRDMPNATDEQKRAMLQNRIDQIKDSYSAVLGRNGLGSMGAPSGYSAATR